MFLVSFQNLLLWFLLFPDDSTWCWKVWENMVKLMGFLQTKSLWVIERGFCIITLLLKSKKTNYSAGISLNRLSDELIPAEVEKCHIFLCLMYMPSPKDLYICDKVPGSEFIFPLVMLPLSLHMCIQILSRLNVVVQLSSFKRAQMFFNRLKNSKSEYLWKERFIFFTQEIKTGCY